LIVEKQNWAKIILQTLSASLLLLTSTCLWSLDLQTVLENTAVTPPARVGFREERHNPMLKEPIMLTGYLEYLKPGQLRKVIETPFEEAFLITEDFIEIERDGKTRRLSLRKTTAVRAMLAGIEAILAGQTDRLVSVFRYELSGTSASWSLQLEPISAKLSAQLTAMLVQGDEKSANSIRMELKDGEWSLMEILLDESGP
jgi:hypothetical protein